jgi:putative transposase
VTQEGYDGGKHIKGRKRFTLVDTLGLLIAVRVVAGSVPERQGAKHLLNQLHQERQRLPRLVRIWVDGGFSGEDFLHWVAGHLSLDSRSCPATRAVSRIRSAA